MAWVQLLWPPSSWASNWTAAESWAFSSKLCRLRTPRFRELSCPPVPSWLKSWADSSFYLTSTSAAARIWLAWLRNMPFECIWVASRPQLGWFLRTIGLVWKFGSLGCRSWRWETLPERFCYRRCPTKHPACSRRFISHCLGLVSTMSLLSFPSSHEHITVRSDAVLKKLETRFDCSLNSRLRMSGWEYWCRSRRLKNEWKR